LSYCPRSSLPAEVLTEQVVRPLAAVPLDPGVEDEVVVPAGDRERVELDRAEPAEDVRTATGPPVSERGGASSCRRTRKRRAASAEIESTAREASGTEPATARTRPGRGSGRGGG
jgi:hypothetical protein